ncbi:MAG: DUF4384 domain-containing protein, partial [Gemmatimonadales bacterium]
MLLPAIALLLQAPPPVSGDRPIRVWLGAEQPVAPGEHVQVFVRTARDGYLTVLRRTTDGRIEVLFPTTPGDQTFVPRGTYEVRGVSDLGAFAALEPPGTGLVLAALSATPFRTREFAHQAAWNPAALEPSWEGADAVGALTDIVQRMLGAGYFVYDLVPYTVAPPRTAPPAQIAGAQPSETCLGCLSPAVPLIVLPPAVLVCDPFLVLCEELLFFPRRPGLDRPPAEPPAPAERVLGIPSAGATPRGVVASRVQRPGFVTPDRPAAPPTVTPRPRGPAAPVLRGHRPPEPPAGRSSSVMPRRRAVRLVMPATPTRSATAARAVPAALAPAGPTDSPVRRGIVAPARAPGPVTAPRSRSLVARPAFVLPARGAATAAAAAAAGAIMT